MPARPLHGAQHGPDPRVLAGASIVAVVLLSLAGGWWLGRQMEAPSAAQQSRQALEKQAALIQQRLDQGQADDREKQRLLELLVALNRREQASQLLEQMADQQPERWRLRLLLAELRLDLGDREGAEREVRQVLNVLPSQIEALQLLTRLQLETGRGPVAAAALKAIYLRQTKPQVRPEALPVGLLLADLERQLKQTAQAEATCTTLARDFPKDPRPLLALALIKKDVGQIANAQQLLQQARGLARAGSEQTLDQVAAAWGLGMLRGRDPLRGPLAPAGTDGTADRGGTPVRVSPPAASQPLSTPNPTSPGDAPSAESPQRSSPSAASPVAPIP